MIALRHRATSALLSFWIVIVLQSMAFAEAPPTATGGADDDLCNADNVAVEARISSCTKAIERGGQTDEPLALIYLNRGNGWYLKGNRDQAKADYETARKLNPGWSRPHVGLGNILRDRKDFAGALLQYEDALKLDPQNSKAYFNRAQLFATTGQVQKALSDYDALIHINPSDPNNYRGRGWQRYVAKDVDGALLDLSEAIKLDPKSPFAYFQRANVLASRPELAPAIADFSEAIQRLRDPQLEPFYRYHRGLAFKRDGQFDLAIEDFNGAIALDAAEKIRDPAHENCCFNRANILFVLRGESRLSKGDYDGAIADFDEALKINPNDAAVYSSRGGGWMRKGDRDRAIADYTESIRLDPANSFAWGERAGVRSNRREYEGAIADYSEAVRLNPKSSSALTNRGNAYHALGRYDLAIKDYDAAIGLDPGGFLAFTNRGNSWRAKRENKRAAEDYLAAIRINPDYVAAYDGLGRAYQNEGRYADAEEQFERAVAVLEKRKEPIDISLANALSDQAYLKSNLGDLKGAAKLWEKSLSIHEKIEGKDHINVAKALAFLASAYSFDGRYQDAEAALRRAVTIAEGKQDPAASAPIYFSLAILYAQTRSYTKQEAALKEALAAYEKQSNPDVLAVEKTLVGLSQVECLAGKYQECAETTQRALARLEGSAATNDPALAAALGTLGFAYHSLGREAEAEGVLRRSIAVYEASLGPDNLPSVTPLHILGDVYRSQDRYRDAQQVYTRVLALREQKLGDHVDTAQTLGNLGDIYRSQGNLTEAETLYDRALAMRERTVPDTPLVAWSLVSLGALYKQTGRFADAEKAYARALAIDEQALGSSHPDLAYLLDDMAILNRSMGNIGKALEYSRRATASLVSLAADTSLSTNGATGYGGVISRRPDYFVRHLAYLAAARSAHLEAEAKLAREAFETAQWANFSTTAAAVQQMSARFSAGDDSLALLVRQRQDDEGVWRERERALAEALSSSKNADNGQAVKAIQAEIADLESSLSKTAEQITNRFPQYAALSRPKPLPIEEIQQFLSSDDGIAFFATGGGSTFIFVVTRNLYEWKEIPFGANDLARKVASFRHGLEIDAIGQLYDVVQERQSEKLFNLVRAYQLYDELFSSVAPLLESKRHLIIVPSGPLTALPFHLLVTEAPKSAVPERLSEYREADWLAKRVAISILPSVGSVKSLSQRPREDAGRKPLVAFGDPVFRRTETEVASNEIASRGATRGYARFWDGSNIDRSELSKLPRLPETADEINAVAGQLGASANDVHLREEANEHNVKTLDLSSFRIVYFATHGLVAGDVEGLGEPALALTLPEKPTAADDGLLTASEAAQLKLNADWVVLSACNTFAGEKPGAEALSGLARAFFYSGARALMVSHWPLDSFAATILTTSTFRFLESGLSHSEAMRKAMLEFMNDTKDPRYAYPAFWAPFVVVGRE